MLKPIHKGLSIAAASFTFFAMALPALAASSSCRFLPVLGKCETGTVAANSSGHFVFFEVSPNANYKVKDESTRVVVASGTAGWRGKRGTISGLYGNEYKLYVDNPFGGYGYISNK